MPISLFPHNQTAYESLLDLLKTEHRACVIHPTGTGKSFIGFKYAEDHPQQSILWLAPSRYIFDTQLENIQKSIIPGSLSEGAVTAVTEGVPSSLNSQLLTLRREASPLGNSFNNLSFMTYAKLSQLTPEELDSLRPDVVILDEMHRAAAPTWEVPVQILLSRKQEPFVIGLTATSIRYLDGQKDTTQTFQMPVASEMTLGEAIVRGILPAPKYILSIFKYKDDLAKYELRAKKAKSKATRDAAEEILEKLRRALDRAEGMDLLFEKHMEDRHGKYLVFCANAEHMREMIAHVPEWFSKVDPQPHVYSAYSEDPSTDRSFAAFKTDDSEHLKLLFCIDMLNEGVHVDDVSGVILLRPTVSPIVYKQQIGRALSAKPKAFPSGARRVKQTCRGHVCSQSGEQAVTATRTGGTTVPDEVPAAAAPPNCHCEERSDVAISRVATTKTNTHELTDPCHCEASAHHSDARETRDDPGFAGCGNPSSLPPAGDPASDDCQCQPNAHEVSDSCHCEAQRAVAISRVVPTKTNTQELPDNCHCDAKLVLQGETSSQTGRSNPHPPSLNSQLSTLNSAAQPHNPSSLNSQLSTLNSAAAPQPPLIFDIVLNIENLYSISSIQEEMQAAITYYRYLGEDAFLINDRFEVIDEVKDCRKLFDDLEHSLNGTWDLMYAEAKKYYLSHGDLQVPAKYKTESGLSLGSWLHTQRRIYQGKAIGHLSDEQVELLNKIGIVWDSWRDLSWERSYLVAKDYYEQHGDLLPPRDYVTPSGFPLGIWVCTMRSCRSNRQFTKLTPERIAKLDAIGMVWNNLISEQWEKNYLEAAAYYKEHGNLLVPRTYISPSGINLGNWIVHLRQAKKGKGKYTLTPEQIARLDMIGMVWDAIEDSWNTAFEEARLYFLEHGSLKVPATYKTPSGFPLGIWIVKQRGRLKNGRIPQHQVDSLNSLGMYWNVVPEVWQKAFEEAEAYYADHGSLKVPRSYKTPSGRSLDSWLQKQKRERDRLSPSQIESLRSIGLDV